MREWEHKLSATFARPSGNTTQYAVGDLVANSATAGSVVQMSWAFQNEIWLRKIRIDKSDPDITSAAFRLWLHPDAAVTFSNGDNGPMQIASSTLAIADVIDGFDVTIDASLPGAGDVGVLTFDRGLYRLPATFYGFLEARGTYTPGDGESFTVTIYGETY